MPSPRRILLLLASMALETRARSGRNTEHLQVELLMRQLKDQDELSGAERGLLLERLVTLARLQEA